MSNATKIIQPLAVIVGTIFAWFLWAIVLYHAYAWISWNFNLPSMTYLNMVSMYGSFDVLCKTLKKTFFKKS